jgi:hypothetical protein
VHLLGGGESSHAGPRLSVVHATDHAAIDFTEFINDAASCLAPIECAIGRIEPRLEAGGCPDAYAAGELLGGSEPTKVLKYNADPEPREHPVARRQFKVVGIHEMQGSD